MILVNFGFSAESGKENRFGAKAASLSCLGPGLGRRENQGEGGSFHSLIPCSFSHCPVSALHTVLGREGGRSYVRNKGRARAGAGLGVGSWMARRWRG